MSAEVLNPAEDDSCCEMGLISRHTRLMRRAGTSDECLQANCCRGPSTTQSLKKKSGQLVKLAALAPMALKPMRPSPLPTEAKSMIPSVMKANGAAWQLLRNLTLTQQLALRREYNIRDEGRLGVMLSVML